MGVHSKETYHQSAPQLILHHHGLPEEREDLLTVPLLFHKTSRECSWNDLEERREKARKGGKEVGKSGRAGRWVIDSSLPVHPSVLISALTMCQAGRRVLEIEALPSRG